jgi:DnaJ family protein A protein 2
VYDESGLEGMKHGRGMAPDADLADLLNQMFGAGVSGFGDGMGGMGDGQKSRDAVQEFEVSLEDLYKGKQVKMMSKRKVVCTTCKGYDLTSTRMGGNW